MKKMNLLQKYKMLPISIVVLLLFSSVFLLFGTFDSSQAKAPMAAGVSFQGEYKIGDGEWHTIISGEHIPANEGDVTLRGIFWMHNPETNEAMLPLPKNNQVNLYFNHIGGTAVLPEGGKIIFNAENAMHGEDACAIMWCTLPSMGDQPITIVLHNPHGFGNSNAIDEFFEHMSITPGIYHESAMIEQGKAERTVGILIFIVSTVILGIAAFSTIIHIKYSKVMWLDGLMFFFAGGYFMFDAFAVSIWNESHIFNTRALGLCMMFYMLFGKALIVTQLKNKAKMVGMIAVSLSAVAILGCISVSFFNNVKFYDTWLWWLIIEVVTSFALLICQILSFRQATIAKKILFFVGSLAMVALILDFFAACVGWWEGGNASKIVFLAVFIVILTSVLRIVPSNINAAEKARELEAEKKELKHELQESRISIMLSQMQPHFIFNTLNTIYHLCDINPELARSAINSFSKYLRNNIENLNCRELISFDKEISFVKSYLEIEKIRFDDELRITFDLPVTNFKLPVLTVQPIVENAVKHGTSKKEGDSTLCISTRETEDCYEIEVRDTGAGFDTSLPIDEKKHVGISNIRQRLKHLCNGTLTIESGIGQGTTAIIQIPKNEEESI